MLDKEIYSYVDSQADLISLLNAKQRGIDDDERKNWTYKDSVGTLHVTANQKSWNGSDWDYATNDLGITYIRDAAYFEGSLYHLDDVDTRIAFSDDQITLTAGGVAILDLVEGTTDYALFGAQVRLGSNSISNNGTGGLSFDGDGAATIDGDVVISHNDGNNNTEQEILKIINPGGAGSDGLGTKIGLYTHDQYGSEQKGGEIVGKSLNVVFRSGSYTHDQLSLSGGGLKLMGDGSISQYFEIDANSSLFNDVGIKLVHDSITRWQVYYDASDGKNKVTAMTHFDDGLEVHGSLVADNITFHQDVSGNGDLAVTGNVTGANLNVSNWNEAYGWGNHADAGYLTSAPSHGTLSGLADDDHTQYLLVSGARAMTGGLKLGSNSISNNGTGGLTFDTSGNITAGGDLHLDGNSISHSGTGGLLIGYFGEAVYTGYFSVDGDLGVYGTIGAGGNVLLGNNSISNNGTGGLTFDTDGNATQFGNLAVDGTITLWENLNLNGKRICGDGANNNGLAINALGHWSMHAHDMSTALMTVDDHGLRMESTDNGIGFRSIYTLLTANQRSAFGAAFDEDMGAFYLEDIQRGGIKLESYCMDVSNDGVGLWIKGYTENNLTGRGTLFVSAYKHDGAGGLVTVGDDHLLMQVLNYDASRLRLSGNGDLWIDRFVTCEKYICGVKAGVTQNIDLSSASQIEVTGGIITGVS